MDLNVKFLWLLIGNSILIELQTAWFSALFTSKRMNHDVCSRDFRCFFALYFAKISSLSHLKFIWSCVLNYWDIDAINFAMGKLEKKSSCKNIIVVIFHGKKHIIKPKWKKFSIAKSHLWSTFSPFLRESETLCANGFLHYVARRWLEVTFFVQRTCGVVYAKSNYLLLVLHYTWYHRLSFA